MAKQIRCPKCDGKMEQGYILDQSTGGSGGTYVSQWAVGEPEHIKFFGVKLEGVTTSKEKRYPTLTLRCKQCGYLESYAPKSLKDKAEKKNKH